MFTQLFNPVNERGVMYTFDSFDGTKSHAINIHLQAFLLDVLGVALWWTVNINKLTTTLGANVILFLSSLTILPNLRTLTVWTLHST